MWSHIRTVAEPDVLWRSPVEVAHLIMDYFDFRDLCRFSCVSILSFQRVSEYLYHNFSVHHILSPFFPNEEDLIIFCEVQRVHGVLISGSQALSIFTRTMYPNSDLDLYVTQWQHPQLITALEWTGYTSHGSLRPPLLHTSTVCGHSEREADTMMFFNDKTHIIAWSEYTDKSIADVEEFWNGLGAVIQVITSYGPPLDVILGFHSSEYGIHFVDMANHII